MSLRDFGMGSVPAPAKSLDAVTFPSRSEIHIASTAWLSCKKIFVGRTVRRGANGEPVQTLELRLPEMRQKLWLCSFAVSSGRGNHEFSVRFTRA